MLGYHECYKIDNFDFYDLTAIVKKAWIVRFGSQKTYQRVVCKPLRGKGLASCWLRSKVVTKCVGLSVQIIGLSMVCDLVCQVFASLRCVNRCRLASAS